LLLESQIGEYKTRLAEKAEVKMEVKLEEKTEIL
jgi:hypothetical protein